MPSPRTPSRTKAIPALAAALTLLAAALPGSASAQSRLPEAGATALSLSVGTDFNVTGNLHRSTVAGPVEVRSRGWGDMYGRPLVVQGDLSWGLNDRSQLGLAISWTMADGRARPVGTADGQALLAKFEDYRALGVRAEWRHYFQVAHDFFPYVGVTGGVKRVSSIDATLASPGLAGQGLPTSLRVPFYRTSWVPGIGATFGWRNEFQGVALGLETGVHFDFRPRGNDSGLAPLGLERMNNAGTRLVVPVRLLIGF